MAVMGSRHGNDMFLFTFFTDHIDTMIVNVPLYAPVDIVWFETAMITFYFHSLKDHLDLMVINIPLYSPVDLQ